MASQSELYKHLWEPKRTTRDWGTTEYRIIRTWTPRAPPSDSDHQSETAGQSHGSQSHSHTCDVSREDGDNDVEMEIGDHSDEEEEDPYLATPSSTLQSLQRGTPPSPVGETSRQSTISKRTTVTANTSRQTTGVGDTTMNSSRLSTKTADVPTETGVASRPITDAGEITTIMDTTDSPNEPVTATTDGSMSPLPDGGRKRRLNVRRCPRPHQDSNEAQTEEQVDLEENEENAVNENSESEDPHSTTLTVGPGSQSTLIMTTPRPTTSAVARGEPAILATETDTGTESEIENEIVRLTAEKQKATRKGRKRTSVKSSGFTLWLTAYQRTGRDLNELDICLSTYDSIMRDAIQNEGDGEVQRAMVRHWKLTRKYMLSTIRDLSATSALEKRHRQEVSKNKRLQKESAATLSRLRKVSGQYLQAVSRAKLTRQTHKLGVEQAEIEELSSQISAYVARQE